MLHLGTKSSRFRLQEVRQSGGTEGSKADRLCSGKQIDDLIYDYFWVCGVNDSVFDSADLYSLVFRHDNIQEFDTRWD